MIRVVHRLLSIGHLSGHCLVLFFSLALFGASALVASADEGFEPVGAGPPLTAETRSRLFEEALHVLGGSTNVISRWSSDIRFAVLGGEVGDAANVARATIESIAVEAGLELVHIDHDPGILESELVAARRSVDHRLAVCDRNAPAVCANFIVMLADIRSMRDLADAIPLRAVYKRSIDSRFDRSSVTHCFFVPFQNVRREIVRAFVFVDKDLSPAMLSTCLNEEMYQSFGLFNDVSGSRFFSFDNRVVPKQITFFDKALLASVYHPDVRTGAPAFAVVQRFLDSVASEPGIAAGDAH